MNETVTPKDAAPLLLPVRAAVHLPDLPLGWEALVDPSDPYIAGLITAQILVPLEALTG